MIVELPIFLAAGFCLGLLQGRGLALFYVALRWNGGWRVILGWVILLGLAALAAVALLWHSVFPIVGLGLQIAAVVVGWAGGRWFSTASAERDKVLFIAAAGVFLILAAVEYEYRLFNFVTKINTGVVNLEFADRTSGAENATTYNFVPNASTSPFRGQDRLDFAIDRLLNLPDFIARDEKYAELFSGYDKYQKDARASLEPMTRGFLDFICEKVAPFVQNLSILHQVHKGEIASITLDPSLMRNLRFNYEVMLYSPFPRPKPAKTPNTEVDGSPAFWQRSGLDPALRHAKTLTEIEAQILKSVAKSAVISEICRTPDNSARMLPQFGDDPEFTTEDADGFVTYFAMLSALAEFAMENRERALQLVDDVILNGTPFDREKAKNKANSTQNPTQNPTHEALVESTATVYCNRYVEPSLSSCKEAAQKLKSARKLVHRIRLENFEDDIIERSDNPDLVAIRISLLKRIVDDMEEALRSFPIASRFDPQILYGAPIGPTDAGCASRVALPQQSEELVARWVTSLNLMRANALEAAVLRPEIVSARPALVSLLDGYATAVASLNVDCTQKMLPESLRDPSLRAQMLSFSARYWEAKGGRFSTPNTESNHLVELGATRNEQIGALCEARKQFQYAQKVYVPDYIPSKSEVELTLDERGKVYTRPTVERIIKDGYARVHAALKSFPVAEVESKCP